MTLQRLALALLALKAELTCEGRRGTGRAIDEKRPAADEDTEVFGLGGDVRNPLGQVSSVRTHSATAGRTLPFGLNSPLYVPLGSFFR